MWATLKQNDALITIQEALTLPVL